MSSQTYFKTYYSRSSLAIGEKGIGKEKVGLFLLIEYWQVVQA